MGLDKGIESGKEKRRKYRRPKDIDSAYRNHGESQRGYDDRTYRYRKAEQEADEKMRDWEDPDNTDLEEKNCEDDGYENYLEYKYGSDYYNDEVTEEDLIELEKQCQTLKQ